MPLPVGSASWRISRRISQIPVDADHNVAVSLGGIGGGGPTARDPVDGGDSKPTGETGAESPGSEAGETVVRTLAEG